MSPWDWRRLAEMALAEDVGPGDITTRVTIEAGHRGWMRLIARERSVICGTSCVAAVYGVLDPAVEVDLRIADGQWTEEGTVVAVVSGPTASLLTGERVCLNVMQRLSGIATATRTAVEAVSGLGVDILDTRKTTPGLRLFEKYAVRTGGGKNHRAGLYDAVLIKDNHIAAAGSLRKAVDRARAAVGHTVFVEVEADSLAQVAEAIKAGPDGILLDNMPIPVLKEAVRRIGGRVFTEASGGIGPDQVRAVAETGVNAVSLGWLTHSARAVDIGADWGTP